MTARELILATLSSRPANLQGLVGMLVSHGYPETTARGTAESWLMILQDRKQVSVMECGGEKVYRLDNVEYEADPDPVERKSCNQIWREAIAKGKK